MELPDSADSIVRWLAYEGNGFRSFGLKQSRKAMPGNRSIVGILPTSGFLLCFSN